MTQTRTQSLIEAIAGTAIGVAVALVTQLAVFWLYDIHTSMDTNLKICAIFTGVSFIRAYLVRRFFNWLFKINPTNSVI